MLNFIKRRLDLLDSLDPTRVYVENVRELLGVSKAAARWLCEKARRDGFWDKWIAFEHPKLGHTMYELPDGVEYDENKVVEDSDLDYLDQETSFKLSELRKVEFYRRELHHARK